MVDEKLGSDRLGEMKLRTIPFSNALDNTEVMEMGRGTMNEEPGIRLF